jgi:F-type H+-transporting ATPase subunit delta
VKDLQVAERYSKALLDLARKEGQDQAVEDTLTALSSALSASPELERFLMNPRLSPGERSGILSKLMKGRPGEQLLTAFLETLFKKHRFELIHGVAESYKRLADIEQNEATVTITSASPLDEASERAIVSRVEKIGGFKAEVHKSVDPSLVGGVVVRYRNRVIDGSVKGRIEDFKKELTKQRTV